MRLHRLLFLLVATVLAAGCGSPGSGGGGGDAGADPAQAIPAGTLFYVEGVVRPEGDVGDEARALVEKFLPAGTTIDSLINQGFDNGESYEKSIKPWLGQRIGFGVTDLTADEPVFIGAVAITDGDKAEAFLKGEGRKAGDYEGTNFYKSDDTFAGVRGDYVVFAQSEADMRKAIDAEKGDSLGDGKTFQDAIGDLPDERLGSAFIDLAGVGKLADSSADLDPAGRAVLKQFLGEDLQPVTAALTVDGDQATIESRFSGEGLARLTSFGLIGGQSTELVQDAPADAFAVFGVADLGATLKNGLNAVAGALGGAALTAQLESQIGINLERDIFSWMGDIAVYAHGDGASTLNGAVVIEATDDAAASSALAKLASAAKQQGAPLQAAKVAGADRAFQLAVPGAPGPVVIAHGDGRVVVAFGEKEAGSALAPSGDTLGDSGRYDDAKDAIDGIAPSLIVDLPKVLVLAEALGAASDSDFQEAKPYLEKLGLLVTGTEKNNDTLRSLFTVTTQ